LENAISIMIKKMYMRLKYAVEHIQCWMRAVALSYFYICSVISI
jgi:uncharacterized protein YeaC (DUF1315 family)